MSDDLTDDEAFAETQGIWWAGIAFASIVTFVVIGGVLFGGTYVLKESEFVDLPYWLPTVAATILTSILIAVAVRRGKSKYKPQ